MSIPKAKKGVLVASTPLHLLDAIMIAAQESDFAWYLFWIDQKPQYRFWYEALIDWKMSPFVQVQLFENGAASLKKKILTKRRHIRELIAYISALTPQKLIVGNDRKNEMAALVSTLCHNDRQACGYMDDGLHTYLYEKSGWWKYTPLEDILKRLVYGYKARTPKTVGCDTRLSEAYLYRPALALECFKKKRCHPLDTDYLYGADFAEFRRRLLIDFTEELADLKEIRKFFFLPHPKALGSGKIDQIIAMIGRDHGRVAVKLHPRDMQTMQIFRRHGIRVLPGGVSAELLFLQMAEGVEVLGFASTALLTAVWLRPDLKVSAMVFEGEKRGDLERLMEQNGIHFLPVGGVLS